MIGCMHSAICTLLLFLILLLTPGCASSPNQGYAFDSGFDESIRTIAVPIFRNETTSRGLEVQLTEAVQKQLQQRTPWRLASTDRADTTLVAVITNTQLNVLSDDPRTGLVQEQAVRITIRFEWRDNRSGEVLVARDGYSASAVFSPSRGVGDRLEMGQRNAIEELATDLVSDLRSSW
jgi:hypothetical protein